MKKFMISAIAVVSLSIAANAGKDVEPAVIPPAPVPVAPKPTVVPPIGLYIGGGLTYAKTDCECDELETTDGIIQGSSSGKTYGVNLRAGYDFNDFIGVEGRFIYTPWGDEDKTLKHYGIYLKPTYGVSENFDLYALLGYGKTKCDYQNLDEDGFAWAVGGEYLINKRKAGKKDGLGIYVEYSKPLRKTDSKDIDTNLGSAGIVYHF